MNNVGVRALATRIDRRSGVAVSRAIGYQAVGIRRSRTRRGADVRIGTTGTPRVDCAVDVVAGDAGCCAGSPVQANGMNRGRRTGARQTSRGRRVRGGARK
jgi:hypothetical protein